MSAMSIVDENGQFAVLPGTLKTIESNHPIYKARIAIALDQGAWLYAPTKGHTLNTYKLKKASPETVESFQKEAKLYLAPYGPIVVQQMISRGTVGVKFLITKETLNG